jgi:hypothetical protein
MVTVQVKEKQHGAYHGDVADPRVEVRQLHLLPANGVYRQLVLWDLNLSSAKRREREREREKRCRRNIVTESQTTTYGFRLWFGIVCGGTRARRHGAARTLALNLVRVPLVALCLM